MAVNHYVRLHVTWVTGSRFFTNSRDLHDGAPFPVVGDYVEITQADGANFLVKVISRIVNFYIDRTTSRIDYYSVISCLAERPSAAARAKIEPAIVRPTGNISSGKSKGKKAKRRK
jgi:hypothetical protein